MLLRTLVTGILLAAGAFAQMSSFPKPSYFRETFQKTPDQGRTEGPGAAEGFRGRRQAGAVAQGLSGAGDGQQHRDPDSDAQAGDAQERHPAGVRASGIRWPPPVSTSQRSTTPSTSLLDGAQSLTTPDPAVPRQLLARPCDTGTQYSGHLQREQVLDEQRILYVQSGAQLELVDQLHAAAAEEPRPLREPPRIDGRPQQLQDFGVHASQPTC